MSAPWKFAASVILWSRTSGRILMMRRGETAKFMPNALVFPGGVIGADDAAVISQSQPQAAARVAALREVFEETGLLLTKNGIESATNSDDLATMQEQCKTDPKVYAKAINNKPPIDDLVEWNTWLTPCGEYGKRRYMTSFFVLPIDGEPGIRMCEKEMAGFEWQEPAITLKNAFEGKVTLPPPQVYELTRLTQVNRAAIESYANREVVFCPQIIHWKDENRLSNVLPGDHLYVEDATFGQSVRELPSIELKATRAVAMHRLEYAKKPLYGTCKVYRHKLTHKIDTILPAFACDSDSL